MRGVQDGARPRARGRWAGLGLAAAWATAVAVAQPAPLPPPAQPRAGQPAPAQPMQQTPQAAPVPAQPMQQTPQAAPVQPAETAPAETSATVVEHGWGRRQIVGGHRFLLGTFLPTAIPASYLGVRAGLQYHRVPGFAQLPTLAGTSEQAVVLETLNVAEVIDFSVHLHDLLTVFGSGFGRARVGANIATLLGTGADYTYGGDVGVMVNVLRADSFLLSVRGQLGGLIGQSAGIVGLFQDLNAIAEQSVSRVLQNPSIDINAAILQLNNSFRLATAGLLTPFSAFNYGASLNAALGLGRFVGVQVSVGIALETAVHRPTHFDVDLMQTVSTRYQIDTLRPTFGAAVDLDLAPLYLPLALMLEYVATPVQVDSSGEIAGELEGSLEQLLALGLFYSGRTDLQLGLTAFTLFSQAPTLGADARLSDPPVDLGAQFIFRYVW